MRTLQHFNNFVKEIISSNSRLHKQAVLQKYKDDEVVKRYLQIAFDPYRVYGLSTKKLYANVPPRVSADVELFDVFELFEYLEEHNTGTFQEIMLCQNLLDGVAAVDRECAELLEKLICKDLSIGCDSKTINKEIPDCVPCFDVQLANRYFDVPEKVEGKYFAITEKIDGGRIIAIKANGKAEFYTRAGQKYEGLVDLEREMLDTYPDGIVLDGEITILNNSGVKSKDAYKAAMKICRKDGSKTGLKMICFDVMSLEEWKTHKCTHSYLERRMLLESLSSTHHHIYFEVLPVLYKGTDTSKITELLDQMVARGSEGIMVNLCDAVYEFKRTNALLKCKKFSDADLEIIGFEEGAGRLKGTLGAILVRYKNGNTVKVGSGFSDEMRAEIWSDTSKFLNAICTVKYFEETTNKDGGISLRFPTFVSIRTDKLEPDF
jgi:DNA ligase-1